jgi:hypothetical protein
MHAESVDAERRIEEGDAVIVAQTACSKRPRVRNSSSILPQTGQCESSANVAPEKQAMRGSAECTDRAWLHRVFVIESSHSHGNDSSS